MGNTRHNVNMSETEMKVKVVASPDAEPMTEQAEGAEQTEAVSEQAEQKPKKQAHGRSKKYLAQRSKVDKTKLYDPATAIELIKRLSYAKFTGSIDASLEVKEVGISATFAFPHSTGKAIRVAVVDDAVLAALEAGTTDFDVLLSKPEFMPKLAKFARVLGPRGLMPNPKNGTLTPNPELKRKQLEGGSITIKTEKKAPLINISFGKSTMETKDLVENLAALTKALNGRIVRMSISASMSPSVKVALPAEVA